MKKVEEKTDKFTSEPFPLDKDSIISKGAPPDEIVTTQFGEIWSLVSGLLAMEALIFGIINSDLSPFVNMFVLIPLVTCCLSYFKPISRQTTVVAWITFLHSAALLGYFLGGGTLVGGDALFIVLLLIANAGVCVGISFVRLQKKPKMKCWVCSGHGEVWHEPNQVEADEYQPKGRMRECYVCKGAGYT